jgi:hypothetical protein
VVVGSAAAAGENTAERRKVERTNTRKLQAPRKGRPSDGRCAVAKLAMATASMQASYAAYSVLHQQARAAPQKYVLLKENPIA